MLKRILVGLGGTPFANSEILHAIELASAFDAELTGVTVVDLERLEDVGPIPIGGGAAAAALQEHRLKVTQQHVQEAILAFRHACEQAKIRQHVICEQGEPFEKLISLWRYHDLTILGLKGLFDYGVFPDPRDQITSLIAHGVRPILAVAESHRRIERVLIAFNGSMESAKAMKRFVQLGLWPNAELHIACFDHPEDQANSLMREASAYCRLWGYATKTTIGTGHTGDGLLNLSRTIEADLIVAGSSAKRSLLKRMLGDTTHHLIANSDRTLFLTQ